MEILRKHLGGSPEKEEGRKGQILCGLWECESEDFVICLQGEVPSPAAGSSPSSLLAFPGVRFPTKTCCAEHVPSLAHPRTSLLRTSLSKPGQQCSHSSTAGLPVSPASACPTQGLQAGLSSVLLCSAAGVICTSPSAPISATSGTAAWAHLQHTKMSKENVTSKARNVTPQSQETGCRMGV